MFSVSIRSGHSAENIWIIILWHCLMMIVSHLIGFQSAGGEWLAKGIVVAVVGANHYKECK